MEAAARPPPTRQRQEVSMNKLVLSFAAALALAAAMIPGAIRTDAGGAGSQAIEGSWRTKVTVPPNPGAPEGRTFDARLTFARGGGLVETDTNPDTPQGGVAHGVWTKTGDRTFATTFEKFAFNPITQSPGVFKVVERIRVDGDTYTGESPAAYFCDADGSNCVLLGPATSVGVRMEVEAD
jgi:hypothetical protein